MREREKEQRQMVRMLYTDMVDPKDHLLRKINKAAYFRDVYTLVKTLYSPDNGKPSVDPIVYSK